MNIVECMDDPVLFEPWFKGSSWDAWRAVLKGAYALPLSESEFAQFHQLTERAPPKKPARELWAICGRRSGKDSIASLIAAFRAAFFDAKASKLRRGERATVMCLATDREQARIVLGYIRAYFNDIPLLKSMVRAETSNGLALKNGVDIVISTSDYRSVRGRAVALAIFDEAAFWPSDGSASPDTAVYDAVRPGTLTVRGSIIGISTPYRKSGLLYERWKEHYGKDDSDVLVVKAPSLALNPTLDPIEIAAELQRDPEKAKAEWLAEWRSDISTFIDLQLIEDAVDKGVMVRPPIPSAKYFGFVDPSGGAADSFTLAIAHREPDGKVVLDLVYERRPPFSPNEVAREMAKILRQYRLSSVQGDHYSAGFVVGIFAECSVQYQHSYRDRSAIYADLIPLFTSGNARLLDVPRGVQQLAALERRTTATKDKIDHPDHGHDDVANAIAGAMTLAADHRRQLSPHALPIIITTRRGYFGDHPSGGGVSEYGGSVYAGGASMRNPAWGLPRDGRDSW
jgi:hypothetical protein